ncbi:MAG: hypothetical protein HUU15_10600 [Candidatus Brocadiae bacterium]|nr:hypothetical protein [Candidatus Brocadiia bacterium]
MLLVVLCAFLQGCEHSRPIEMLNMQQDGVSADLSARVALALLRESWARWSLDEREKALGKVLADHPAALDIILSELRRSPRGAIARYRNVEIVAPGQVFQIVVKNVSDRPVWIASELDGEVRIAAAPPELLCSATGRYYAEEPEEGSHIVVDTLDRLIRLCARLEWMSPGQVQSLGSTRINVPDGTCALLMGRIQSGRDSWILTHGEVCKWVRHWPAATIECGAILCEDPESATCVTPALESGGLIVRLDELPSEDRIRAWCGAEQELHVPLGLQEVECSLIEPIGDGGIAVTVNVPTHLLKPGTRLRLAILLSGTRVHTLVVEFPQVD